MKKLLILALTGFTLMACAQESREHISKQFNVQKPASGVLAVYNVNGPIKVEGYNGTQVVIEVEKIITAKDQQGLDEGKSAVKLGFDQSGDSVICYTAAPYDSRPNNNNNNESRRRYRVRLEYTVKVPFNMNLNVSTINAGDIDVKEVYGALKVNNINGAIAIANAKGKTKARTINGNLTVSYLTVPADSSSYYTLNGKLEAVFPAALSADLEFKTMNGQFYTDFPNAEVMPGRVIKTVANRDAGTLYKLDKDSMVRIGTGGKLFRFETLNGNIYIKKQ